jgi:type II secretory pathway component PulF
MFDAPVTAPSGIQQPAWGHALVARQSLRSGYSLLQSMETVSKELPIPISTEFERVTREIGLGLTIEEALAHLLERIDSDDLDLIITAINIQHEVGGNLAEILDTISHTIRERVRIRTDPLFDCDAENVRNSCGDSASRARITHFLD